MHSNTAPVHSPYSELNVSSTCQEVSTHKHLLQILAVFQISVKPPTNVWFRWLRNVHLPQRAWETIKSAPSTICIPLLLFAILAAGGVYGVKYSASIQNASILQNSMAVSQSTVMALELSLYVAIQPALILASFIRQFPQWPDLAPRFQSFVGEIFQQASAEVRLRVCWDRCKHSPSGCASIC